MTRDSPLWLMRSPLREWFRRSCQVGFAVIRLIQSNDHQVPQTGGSFITFFAPTNDAFRALPLPELNDLIANPSKMKQFLMGHMVYGKIAGPDLRSGDLRFENGDISKVTVTRGNFVEFI